MITTKDIQDALNGTNPKRERKLTMQELGEAIAPHRQGRTPGVAYGKAAISNMLTGKIPISGDFADAFHSWRAEDTSRLSDFKQLNIDGVPLEEMFSETSQIQVIGTGKPRMLVVVREFTGLVNLNGVATPVQYDGDLFKCEGCGKPTVKRSWNQTHCKKCGSVRREARSKEFLAKKKKTPIPLLNLNEGE
jgi:hypothetical protein